jgi:hypothetical protein
MYKKTTMAIEYETYCECDEDEGICSNCRSVEPINKLVSFKQFHGQYCRDCYELIDDDEEDDNNYIIKNTIVNILYNMSNPSYDIIRYKHKMVMNQIKIQFLSQQ